MNQPIPSPDESLKLMNIFEQKFVAQDYVTDTSSGSSACHIYTFENYAVPVQKIPERHSSIGELVGSWEKDNARRIALEEARRWVADTFHSEEGVTVRTLRLRRGWSQSRLAEELGTSQSHVARIERGTENVSIDTCRRLCRALEIDMNTLDNALKQQEMQVSKANKK